MPKQAKTSGSITQWISVCKCDSLQDLQAPETTAQLIDICPNCGKRLQAGRAGSLTQWVFRADLCTCNADSKALVDDTITGESDDSESESKFSVESLRELPELKVDAANFPVERYAPHQILGQGASGYVYLCIDRLLEKLVAVKVLHHLVSDQLIAFQREAKATSQLHHDGILKVLDFGATADGFPFMVMEFIEGISLEDLINEHGPLEPFDVVSIGWQISRALGYAHNRGVYHRDLKPSNVIIVEDSRRMMHSKLIDFGVAEFKGEVANVDSQGRTLVGTPAYMSPDRALGHAYDNRCEVYSLGCLLFMALTGKPSFLGATALETLSLHANSSPPLLSEVEQDIEFPEELEAVVSKCLRKSPDDRFQNMDELAIALADLEDVIEVSSRIDVEELESEEVESSSKESRDPTKLILFSVTAALTVIIAFSFVVLSSRQEAKILKKLPKPPALADAFDRDDKRRWSLSRGEWGPQWTTTPETTDEDFKKLRKEDVRAVVIGLNDKIKGVGFKYLKDKPIAYINSQASALSEEGLKEISKLKTLEWVRISVASNVTSEGLRYLTTLPKLRTIDLLICKIPVDAPDIMSEAPLLVAVSFFESNPLEYKRLEKLQKLENLFFMDVTGTGLNNDALPSICKLTQLEALRLCDNNIDDEKLQLLTALPLTELRLSKTKVTDKGIQILTKIKTLKLLLVDDCPGVTGAGAAKFRKVLPNVKVVHGSSDQGEMRLHKMFDIDR